jgi:hypothetical protein
MSTTALDEAKKDIESRKAWSLARDAECGDPDSTESAGALLLTGVRDAVLDLFDADDINDGSDTIHEIADGAPSVYTHRRFQEFVDLQAYQEDPTELGSDGSDMTEAAGICLYIIAERLARSLWDELAEAAAEDEDEEV